MFAHQRMNPNVEYPDEFSEGTYSTPRRKRGSNSRMKARIGSPRALNSIHLKLDGHESFGTSSPHRYVNERESSEESAPTEEKLRDSAIAMSPYIPDMKVPYGVIPSSRLLDPRSAHVDDQSSISLYSKESRNRDSSLSTYPMLQDDTEVLTSPPPAATKNVRFLSPLPKIADRSTGSTFSSMLNSYLADDSPKFSDWNRSHRQNVAVPPKTVPPVRF